MLQTVLTYLKDNVKVTLTVVVIGCAVTFGWAKGCTADLAPASVAAPALP